MDDVVLIFIFDYLVEFFEIYVSLKLMRIVLKVLVYLGMIEYGMKFYFGYDVEKVECWINVSDNMFVYN